MARVTLSGVSRRFGSGDLAVRDVSLDVAEGELLVLVGPSGCGKSTTLNLVAGLERPDAGTVAFDGVVVNELPPAQRDVAMVFQSYALYPHLTVRQNLAFPLEVAHGDRREIAARVAETAERLELTPLLDRRPAALSGGQRQRVALGRALVRRPRAFLFDEPLSNLDAALRNQTRGEIKRLHRELSATFLYVTHDQVEAMTLADRVAVMNRGRIEQLGTPAEIYDAPATTFVARFFGNPPINLAPPAALGLPAGPGTLAGVRPELVELGIGAPPPGAVSGVIDLVEPLGAEAWITVAVPGARVAARARPDFPGATGDAAWIRVPPERVLWFAEDGGSARGAATPR